MSRSLSCLPLALGLAMGCAPTFEDRPWRVDEARVLAVAATPAEARPGEGVTLTALVADPDGEVPLAPQWTVCTQPRSIDERTGVSRECALGTALMPVGNPAFIPGGACALFGPNPPPVVGDEPPRRPADPDPSGGYFLPVGVGVSSLELQGFGFVRLRCDLAGATRAVFDDWEQRYASNLEPSVEGVSLLDVGGTSVGPGETVTLEAVIDPSAAEPYVVYDASLGAIVDRREVLTVHWYVTDGELDRGRQTWDGDDASPPAVQWRAPETEASVAGWVVVVDDRGGTSWASFAVEVR
ncbi:MAG: hypothetical protein AAF799_07005 [Myxococcota bacterium]